MGCDQFIDIKVVPFLHHGALSALDERLDISGGFVSYLNGKLVDRAVYFINLTPNQTVPAARLWEREREKQENAKDFPPEH